MSTPSLLAICWSRADPAGALFVFLILLKAEPEATGKLYLRDACFPATQTDLPPHLNVRVPGRSWAELGRPRPRFGLLAHGSALLHLASLRSALASSQATCFSRSCKRASVAARRGICVASSANRCP